MAESGPPAVMSSAPPVKAVIFDLDGTLLDTETLVLEVAKGIVAKHGASLTLDAQKAGMGKRPLEAWQAVIDTLGLDATAEQLYAESEPLLTDRWSHARLLPGAARLLQHLRSHGVLIGMATSTPRATYVAKTAAHPEVAASFQTVQCGDEARLRVITSRLNDIVADAQVESGKPAPDCFAAAAQRLGVPPAECLVVEDAPSGVEAATAAAMRVVLVPSIPKTEYPPPDPAASAGVVAVLPSLLDFKPAAFGLPPFDDEVAGAVVLDPPWRIAGTVVKGFGRGSKELGIPTANLDRESLHGALAQAVSGIYLGWASVGADAAVHNMVMSIGWNPYYKNEERTAEPWILHDFGRDFYGEQLRLVVAAYIRPETDFTSLDALIARIHADADVARAALDVTPLASLAMDPFLKPADREPVHSKAPVARLRT